MQRQEGKMSRMENWGIRRGNTIELCGSEANAHERAALYGDRVEIMRKTGRADWESVILLNPTAADTLGAEAAARDDAARDVARLWVAEGERYEVASGDLLAALDRLAAAYGVAKSG